MKKILSLFSFNNIEKSDAKTLNKIILINCFSFVHFLFFVFTAFHFLMRGHTFSFISLIIAPIILLINYILFKKNQHTELAGIITSIIVSLALLYLIITGGIEGSGVFWILTLPVTAIFILGLQRGVLLSVIFFGFSVILFLLPESFHIVVRYTFDSKLVFSITFTALILLCSIFEYFRNESYQQLEKAVLNSQLAFKEKDEFITNLSHQIRTPLNNIQGIIDLVSETQLTEYQRGMIYSIEASANNLLTAVSSISRNAEIKNGGVRNENLSFNLQSTINSTIQLFSNQSASNFSFVLNCSSDIPQKIIGNPIKVKQVFLNLIEFFIKNKTNEKIKLEINVGIKEHNERIIDCNFELKCDSMILLNAALNNSDSSWILALDINITKNIIESSGGKFNIITDSNGTTCTFSLAFKKDQIITDIETKVELPVEKQNIEVESSIPVELENANILLVEDNQINQKIMVLSLKKMVKNIDLAGNGKEALEKFATTKYDLILMDVMMPVMDGIKTTMKIRETEFGTNSHIPIIAITANALSGHREECIAAGMDDYVSKPFQIKVVLEKIKFHLSKKASNSGA